MLGTDVIGPGLAALAVLDEALTVADKHVLSP
jgi:hypothetical protein